jgi:hypothetical protein
MVVIAAEVGWYRELTRPYTRGGFFVFKKNKTPLKMANFK